MHPLLNCHPAKKVALLEGKGWLISPCSHAEKGNDHDYPTLELSTQWLAIALRKCFDNPAQVSCISTLIKNAGPHSAQGASPFQPHINQLPAMDHTSLAATTLINDLSRSLPLSFVCEPPQSISSSMDQGWPSSQIRSSLSMSSTPTDIQILAQHAPTCTCPECQRLSTCALMKTLLEY